MMYGQILYFIEAKFIDSSRSFAVVKTVNTESYYRMPHLFKSVSSDVCILPVEALQYKCLLINSDNSVFIAKFPCNYTSVLS